MKKTKWIAFLLLIALLLSACGADEQPQDTLIHGTGASTETTASPVETLEETAETTSITAGHIMYEGGYGGLHAAPGGTFLGSGI